MFQFRPIPVTSSSARLNYTLAKTGNIVFRLTDANGLQEQLIKREFKIKGTNNYTLNNLSALHKGYYYVSVEQDGEVIGKITFLIAH